MCVILNIWYMHDSSKDFTSLNVKYPIHGNQFVFPVLYHSCPFNGKILTQHVQLLPTLVARASDVDQIVELLSYVRNALFQLT